jgi:hypothetical protein
MEDFDDDELDEDFDDADDDEPTVPCPYCRREIHEDAQRCPYCERYISAEDAPAGRKPWWILVGVVLCLLMVLGWLWG